MERTSRRPVLLVAAPLAVLGLLMAVACGGDDNGSSSPTIAYRTPAGAATTAVPTTAVGETATVAGQKAPATTATTGATTGEATLTIETTAKDPLAFSVKQLKAAPGAKVTIEYTNNSPVPHNIHFFNGKDAQAPNLAMTQIATGPNAVEKVTFTAPEQPGSYFFHCDVHPTQMQGELVVGG
jgi:plastocyanin